MDALGQYVLQLVGVCLLCGVCLSLLEEGAIRAGIRLLCGVILSVLILRPLTEAGMEGLLEIGESFSGTGEAAAAMGQAQAEKARQEIIKQQLEAYIQDKALACGTVVAAEITLDEEGYPVHAELTGSVPPAVQQNLSRMLWEALGIPEEEQRWIG